MIFTHMWDEQKLFTGGNLSFFWGRDGQIGYKAA